MVSTANTQSGFVFWNHPEWKPEAKGWFDIHTKLYENNWLHGIEVANGDTYDPEAHQWCLEKGLTMIGSSDMHDSYLVPKSLPENHRSMTLVFARDKSIEGMREALTEGRTIVWCNNRLIGKEEYLEELFKASVEVAEPNNTCKDVTWLEIRNRSNIDIEMERIGALGPLEWILPANSTTILKTKVNHEAKQVKLLHLVKNILTAPEKGLSVNLIIPFQ